MIRSITGLAAALGLLALTGALADEKKSKDKPKDKGEKAEAKAAVEVGKPAPDFTLKDHDGKEVKLASFRGKKNVLIAFYPKDFTGG